jgi:hypothetical protein
MPLQAGSRLGPYELQAPIGAGGMGEVWRGKDTRLDRAVAVKILPASFAQDEDRRARFEREAKTISSLSHPHICTLFDVGREGDAHFLVMELLEGESLAENLFPGRTIWSDTTAYRLERIGEGFCRAPGVVPRTSSELNQAQSGRKQPVPRPGRRSGPAVRDERVAENDFARPEHAVGVRELAVTRPRRSRRP